MNVIRNCFHFSTKVSCMRKSWKEISRWVQTVVHLKMLTILTNLYAMLQEVGVVIPTDDCLTNAIGDQEVN